MKTILTLIISLMALVPKPVSQEPVLKDGEQIECKINLSSISIFADPSFVELIPTWQEFLSHGAMRVSLNRAPAPRGASITITANPSMQPEEYSIRMDESTISVEAATARGAWWALQSLTQIALSYFDGSYMIAIPAVKINDAPAFAYRGAHLDCCRHFFTVEEVKTFINIMCVHKLNTLHWHLTDDQGWRINIEKYPLLTQIGSIRKETLIGHFNDQPHKFDGKPYGEGMYYTKEQVREVVEYAAARQVDIIPEIEMPGHMVAALTAYPYLGCTGGPYEVWTKWGISDDVLCLGKESSYEFIRDVLDEVCEMFPYKYIHIGGDEAPVVRRKECPHCQAKMKELGITSEVKLQGHLISRVEQYLKTKGRDIIGWDEILDAGVSKDAIIMSWRGPKGGIQAAKQGNRVIMTPNNYFYLDYYQAPDPSTEEPLGIGGRVTLEQCYSFNPYDQLNDEQKQFILGIQANSWTEFIPTFQHLQHMDLPRFTALSEDSWSAEKESFSQFKSRVKTSMLPVYEFFGFTYAPYEFYSVTQ